MTLSHVTSHTSVAPSFAPLTQGHANHSFLHRGSYIREYGLSRAKYAPIHRITHIGTQNSPERVICVTHCPARKRRVSKLVTGHAFNRDHPSEVPLTVLPASFTPEKTPATTPDDTQTSHDILDMLRERGLTGDDLTRTAKAWLCTQAEINMWAAKTNTPTTDSEKAQREISKLATQIEIAIRQHGRIQTAAFATMTPDKLLEAIDWYEQQLDEMWPAYRDGWQAPIDEHATTLAKWTRLNTLLWEAKLTADIPTVTHQVLTGQSLASRLADALKGATA